MSNIQSAYQPNRFKVQAAPPPAPPAPAPPAPVPPAPAAPPAPAPPNVGAALQINSARFYQPQGMHNPALVDPGQFSNMSQYRAGATEYLFDSDYDEDDDNIYAGGEQPPAPNYFEKLAPSQERALFQPLTENQVHANQCNLMSAAVFDENKYPWIASIQNKTTGQHVKTGVLVYTNLILSIYDSVLTDISNIVVRIGGVNLDNPVEFDTRFCSGMIKHPEYNIILLKLSEPVFNHKPVALNNSPSGYLNGVEVGWGSLSGKSNTKILFEMNVPLLRPDVCKNAFKSKFNENINICGGFPECSTILPCIGDTGDPLIVNVNGEMKLEGISEYHINCEFKLGLASWIRVSAFDNWIRQTVMHSPSPPPPSSASSTTNPPTTIIFSNGTQPTPGTIILSTAPPPPTRTASRFATTTRATVPLTSTSKDGITPSPTGTPRQPCNSGGNNNIVILVIVLLLLLALYALTKL